MNKENMNNEAIKLTDESLDQVSGGSIFDLVNLTCRHCGWVNVVNMDKNEYTCVNCGKTTGIMG